MRTTLTLASSLVVALAGAALAQTTPPLGALFISPMGYPFRASDGQTGVQKWFAQADTDHDGKISLAEFIADADVTLAHADGNGDGSVTSVESTAIWRAEAPEVISGSVNPGEPLADNQDVDSRQRRLGAGNSSRSGELAVPGDARPHTAFHDRPTGAQAYGLLGDPEPIMSCDSNFDRRIEKTEFEQCAARRFVRLDANHDGFFAADEVHPWLTDQGRAER